MADLGTTTAATTSISIGVTIVTAIGASVSSALGIEFQAILWAMIGGFFGAALGPPVKQPWAFVRYCFASVLSALAASLIERKLDGGSDPAFRNLLASAISFGFYPLTKSFIAKADLIFGTFIHRWFGVPETSQPQSPSTGADKLPPISRDDWGDK